MTLDAVIMALAVERVEKDVVNNTKPSVSLDNISIL
jgi:hypothetical protein